MNSLRLIAAASLAACSVTSTSPSPSPSSSPPPEPPPAATPDPPAAPPPPPPPFAFVLDGKNMPASDLRADHVSIDHCARELRFHAELTDASTLERGLDIDICVTSLPSTKIVVLDGPYDADYPQVDPPSGNFVRYHDLPTGGKTDSWAYAIGASLDVVDDGTSGAFAGTVSGSLDFQGTKKPFTLGFSHVLDN
jgi:hypothetical protein